MQIMKSSAARIAGFALLGGLTAGGLLALSTPTHMRREGDTWREMIGIREVSAQDTAISFYAPPEDPTPVHWQSAADEYPAGPAVDWSASGPDYQAADYSAADYTNDVSAEVDAPELMAASVSDPAPAARDDDAAASADAALAAAQDVRAQENAAADPQANAPVATSSDANVT